MAESIVILGNLKYIEDVKKGQTDSREISNAISNRFKSVVENIISLAEKAVEKGQMSIESLEELVKMIPSNSMFTIEHTENLNDLIIRGNSTIENHKGNFQVANDQKVIVKAIQ